MLVAEIRACTPEPSHHFIHDQQNIVFVANPANRFPIPIRRNDGAATRASNRFGEESGNRLCALGGDGFFEFFDEVT